MKKFSALLVSLSFFLLFTSPAFASVDSFTASCYSYNPSTHVLRFAISAISPTPSHNFRAVGISNPPDDSFDYAYINTNNPSFPYTTSPINQALNVFNVDIPNDSTNVAILAIEHSTDQVYLSQNITGSDLLSGTHACSTSAEIAANPSSSSVTVGTPFTVDVKVTDTGDAFNAAQSTVAVSSNLSVTGISYPTANSCNFNYTKRPTTSDPSFAGAIFGGSSLGCTAYTLTLSPNATGTGTITFTNGSIKAYADNSEMLTGVQDGSYTISAGPTPTPTVGVPQLTITSPLLTYLTSYSLAGGKDTTISHVFVNSSETGVSFPTTTTWQESETLSLGNNSYTIYGTDGSGNQTATQTVGVDRHTLGDINGDGNIDLIDASLFAVDFGKTSNLTYILSDMNGDGSADLADLSILAKLE